MVNVENSKIKVYFDGLCHLCSAEIVHYRKLRGSENIIFLDITSSEFNAALEGVDPVRVHREMHVRKADGTFAIGVDAFIAIWNELPRYRFAARWGNYPLPKLFLRAGYKIFATIRPYLPRKKGDCSESPYCEVRK